MISLRLPAAQLLLAALLAAAATSGLGRTLYQAAPTEAPPAAAAGSGTTKVGLWRDSPEPQKSFDSAVMKRVDELASLGSQIVELPSLDDRITGLQNGTIDWVVAALSVTPERTTLVDFCLPYYYSAGAALYAPGGSLPDVASWEDVRGKSLVTLQGYFANEVLESRYGAMLVLVNTTEEAVAKVAAGEGVAAVFDSTTTSPGGDLQIVASLPPLLPTPYGIAVAKGNTELKDKISAALLQMATGGSSSDLARIEQEYFVSAGLPPNPDLAALLADPTSTTVLLGKEITA